MTAYHSLNVIGSSALKPINSSLKPEGSLRPFLKTSCNSDVTTHCSGKSSLFNPFSHLVDVPLQSCFCPAWAGTPGPAVGRINKRILSPHSLKTSRFLCGLHSNSVTSGLWHDSWSSDLLTLRGQLRKNVLKSLLVRNVDLHGLYLVWICN